jgi:GDP-4-dehydro-6-deoxy-D-mannose reductase
MSTILVFGANGFSGSNFIKYVKYNTSDAIIGVTRANYDSDYEVVDITNIANVESIILNVEPNYIINLSGSYSNDYDNDYNVNVLGSKNILDTVLKNGLLNIKILLIGTSGEYGVKDYDPICENHSLFPSSIYALTKVFQAELASLYSKILQLNVCLVRTSNLIGPWMPEKLFIGNFFKQALSVDKNKNITIGSEGAYRDYLDIRDAVSAYYGILKQGVSGEVYNLGSGSATQIKTIIDVAANKIGIKRDQIKSIVSDSVKQVDYQLLDISKINKLLGFKPKHTIQDSIDYVVTEMQK